jgi:cell division protein FtsZ
MVRPGLVNLDFADVETVMKGMGKAMMGTGEAEGEKRAEEATNAALNNPLIDEYSLKGAKGLLVNITGGTDLTLFEVDEAVNKMRAEVDPEAELIFGSIEDENLNGKIRVSIVATSLDGQFPQTKPIISMVHRLQNRNTGYTDSSINTFISSQPTLSSTEGATALDMNTVIEHKNENEGENKTEQNKNYESTLKQDETKTLNNEISLENISMENASYLQNIENTSANDPAVKYEDEVDSFEVDSIELATPELFTDNLETKLPNIEDEQKEPSIFENFNSREEVETKEKEPEMFDEPELEEDFEIPAFLRKQKN